ncbi:MAG: nitrite reductase small subunit NirD [Pontibacterium sp.]
MTTAENVEWKVLCNADDLVANSGVAARLGDAQIALFYLPGYENEVYALCNHDRASKANVIARGIVGDLQGEAMVASPLYKQHYALKTGSCLEDETLSLRTWPARLKGGQVEIYCN